MLKKTRKRNRGGRLGALCMCDLGALVTVFKWNTFLITRELWLKSNLSIWKAHVKQGPNIARCSRQFNRPRFMCRPQRQTEKPDNMLNERRR